MCFNPYFLPIFLRLVSSPETMATSSEFGAVRNAGSTATCARCPSPTTAYRIFLVDLYLRLIFMISRVGLLLGDVGCRTRDPPVSTASFSHLVGAGHLGLDRPGHHHQIAHEGKHSFPSRLCITGP